MSWLKKSTSTVATKKAEEAPASPPAEPPAGETPPALPPMTSAPNVNRLSMSMRLPPISGPPQLKKTNGPGSGIGGSVPVPGGGVPPPANGGVPPAASTNGGPAQSPTSPPATRSPFFARAAAASSNGNGSTSPKHPAFAKAAPPPPAELDESSAGPTSPTSTRTAEPEADGSPSLGSSLSGSAKSVPGHRDRKSFHPAFAAVPPPKPGGFSKPVPPSRRNRDSIPQALQEEQVNQIIATGSPDSVGPSPLSSSSSYTSSGEMKTSTSPNSRPASRALTPDWEDETDYPFNEEDSEKNLIFTPETVNQPRPSVKAGKLEKLIERLTYEKYPDPDYVNAFLLTYRSFTTPTEFLALLVTRYNVPAPKGVDEKELDAWVKNKQSPIQLRVFNVLKAWVQTHFYDFGSDTSLTNTLLEFINTSMMGTGNMAMEKAGEQLKRLVAKKMEGNETESEVQFSSAPPKPIVPLDTSSIELVDIDPVEIARQLTLIEYALYKSIKPWECLGQAWTKKATRDEKAPNIMAMIQRFNSVSRWVTTEILKVENIKKRAATLERFIQIAMGCEKLNNYNAMMEIISGLQCSAIFRLKHTWAACNKSYIKKYEEIHALMSRERNFQKFRDHLHSVDPPCIPYLGVYLTDLTFIEDGNKDYVTDEGLINFDKRRKISTVIREIQQYQQTPYCLEAVPWLQDMLNKVEYWEENETYSASTRLEPKDMAPPQKKKPSASQIFASSKDLLKKRSENAKSKRAEKDKEDASKSPVVGSQVAHPVQEEKEEEEDFGELEQIASYRFYAPDSKDNLVFDIDVSAMVEGARPTIKAATIEKLLERLTHENWPDPSLVNTFLLTYRTFTTAQEVIDLLVMRFNIPWPKDTSPELRERYNTAKRIPIRLRVFNVAKNWVDKYVNDQSDPSIVKKFEALADLMIQDGMDKPGQALKRTIQRQREGGETVERRMMSKPPAPYLPSNLTGTPTLMDYHPEEIARQLTLIEQKLFLQLKPWELLNQSWTAADKDKAAPNILAILQRETRTRLWVGTDVVKQPTIEAAAQHITQWIKIAEKCLNLNNFSSMVEIVSALMMPDIQKLKFVWSAVSSKNTFNKLKGFTEGNFTKLQDKLHNVQPPCLPYLNAYLHTLVEIDEKHPALLQGLINFEKRTLMATAISEIQQYQQTLYCLEAVPFIQEWIESEEVWTADQVNEATVMLMIKPEKTKPIKKTTLKGPLMSSMSSIPSMGEDEGEAPKLSPAMANANLSGLSRTTSSKLAKLLGKEYDEQQQQARDQPIHSPKSRESGAQSRASVSSWKSSISASREGSRESAEELGIDRRQSLKLQLLSMFLDDAEFRQSVQEVVVQDLRKEIDEFKAASNAQIASLKEEVAALKARLPPQ